MLKLDGGLASFTKLVLGNVWIHKDIEINIKKYFFCIKVI